MLSPRESTLSPFANALRETRFSKGLRQQDLADLLGCERTYISSIENDLKQVPPSDFVDRLVSALDLSPDEGAALHKDRLRSRRRFVLPSDVPPAAFHLVHDLFEKVEQLSERQVQAISLVLKLGDGRAAQPSGDGRLRRKDRRRPVAEAEA